MPAKTLASRLLTTLTILTTLGVPPSAVGQKIFTVAGGYIGDGKPATSAGIGAPVFATYDQQGNLLFSDAIYCRIRKVDTHGIVSTIAGTGICGFGGDGGPATKAKISTPTGIAVDSAGDIFFADWTTQRVRKIDLSGIITTFAGNGTSQYCGDGKKATKACLFLPEQLSMGKAAKGEILYIADTFNQRIRQVILATGIITTAAGNGVPGYRGDGFSAKLAELNYPEGVAFNGKTHSLWISDTFNSAIRQVDLKTGIITTFVGSGQCDLLCSPQGLSADKSGNLHVADSAYNQVLGISFSDKSISVDSGVNGGGGFNGDGIPANSALLRRPTDVVLDPEGAVLTIDSGNARIRKGRGSQKITTVAGAYNGDGGPATNSTLGVPTNVAFDPLGNLYIATQDERIRKIAASGNISTFAGNGHTGYSGDGGPAKRASLDLPWSVADSGDGSVFIGDYLNAAIRKVDKGGTISTFANANGPTSMSADAAGDLYVVSGCVIQKIAPDNSSTIVAGVQNQCGFNSDGIPATEALLAFPSGVALNSKGDLYIGDTSNNRVRMVDGAGIIHTVAGNGTCGFSGDGGLGTNAMVCFPRGIAPDDKGSLYIADFNNLRVRVLNNKGIISTAAGTGKPLYNGDGLPALKTNIYPTSVALSPSGEVYVVDISNKLVRRIQ